jgi:hypothetical protein
VLLGGPKVGPLGVVLAEDEELPPQAESRLAPINTRIDGKWMRMTYPGRVPIYLI